jgi:vacuolar-type H+-ATPase subunit F/Vma7
VGSLFAYGVDDAVWYCWLAPLPSSSADRDTETQTSVIEAAFQEYTEDRKDIAILLINQHVG